MYMQHATPKYATNSSVYQSRHDCMNVIIQEIKYRMISFYNIFAKIFLHLNTVNNAMDRSQVSILIFI